MDTSTIALIAAGSAGAGSALTAFIGKVLTSPVDRSTIRVGEQDEARRFRQELRDEIYRLQAQQRWTENSLEKWKVAYFQVLSIHAAVRMRFDELSRDMSALCREAGQPVTLHEPLLELPPPPVDEPYPTFKARTKDEPATAT